MIPATATNLRPIVPMTLTEDMARATDYGVRPTALWVPPIDLLVDDSYQRDLRRSGVRLINKIVAEFRWSKVKPPICVKVGKQFHVIDGQHTAMAAATLRIPEIMIVVVDAGTATDRANSFVAHNQDRVAMGQMDIFRAKLGGQDPDALAVDRVCKATGVRFRPMHKFMVPKVGDTGSVGVVRALVKRHCEPKAQRVLQVLTKAGRAPISAAEIQAVEHVLLLSGDKAPSDSVLVAVIKGMGDDGLRKCETNAKRDRVATKVTLALEYRKQAGK